MEGPPEDLRFPDRLRIRSMVILLLLLDRLAFSLNIKELPESRFVLAIVRDRKKNFSSGK